MKSFQKDSAAWQQTNNYSELINIRRKLAPHHFQTRIKPNHTFRPESFLGRDALQRQFLLLGQHNPQGFRSSHSPVPQISRREGVRLHSGL